MIPEDVDRMARYLGRDDPAIRRLLKAYVRDPKIADTVRAVLKRRCVKAGFDPDDPPVFMPPRSLPEGFVGMGRIDLGGAYGPEFRIPRDIITQHVGIFGHNGTGKSFLAMHLALQAIEAGLKVWVLDVEDEYCRLVPMLPDRALVALTPQDLRFNFFQPPGPWVTPANWLGEISLLLRGGTFLRDGSLNMFHTQMPRLLIRKGIPEGSEDWPSLDEVTEYFGGIRFGPKHRSAGFVESLLNRLQMLREAFECTANVTAGDMLSALAKRSVIFRLHGMTGIPLQFLVGFLLLWLARYREAAKDNDGHVVIIEEAHMLASEKSRIDIGESILCRMFRTARKRDMALVLCDQVPSELPPAILGNLGCRLVMRLTNARCIWSLQSSMGLRRDQVEEITELQQRQAVVQYQLHPTPFIIKVPELAFADRPAEPELRTYAEPLLKGCTWGRSTPELKAPGGSVASLPIFDDLVGDPLLVMVRICEHPAEPIDQRCEALRMERSREFRARGELDDRGLIGQVDQTIGRIKLFQPTEKGIAWAEKRGIRVRKFKSGIIHEYLLFQVERAIGKIGPKWRLQRNSSIAHDYGLQPDLLVMAPEGERIIIEVCCSNLDYDAENVLNEAEVPGVDRLIAITPDKRTRQSLEKALGKARSSERQANIAILDAGECLSAEFDWVAALLGSRGPRDARGGTSHKSNPTANQEDQS